VDYDEFGLLSTSGFWVPEPMIRVLLRRIAPGRELQVATVERADLPRYRSGWAIIDVRRLVSGF
jgi:hypothetical protein